tara:strand:+ start:5837 stop:6199 length:363 start_codon:yes stop_codon:yes gene_type:complete
LPLFEISFTAMNSKILIGWTTLPSEKEALDLARGMVEDRLAACAQVDGPVQSTFRWKGIVDNAEEWRLVAKFHKDKGKALEQWLSENHPYDEPQWIAVEADLVSASYANWVSQEAGEDND